HVQLAVSAVRHLLSFFSLTPPPPRPTLFPYTTLFRSGHELAIVDDDGNEISRGTEGDLAVRVRPARPVGMFQEYWRNPEATAKRSEEHTSELQSRFDLVCRLLLEKKKKNKQ